MDVGTDLAVVGGGVVGTAIAYFAARSGMSCMLIEKGVIGCGASNAASGVLSPSPGEGDYARLSRSCNNTVPQPRESTSSLKSVAS